MTENQRVLLNISNFTDRIYNGFEYHVKVQTEFYSYGYFMEFFVIFFLEVYNFLYYFA